MDYSQRREEWISRFKAKGGKIYDGNIAKINSRQSVSGVPVYDSDAPEGSYARQEHDAMVAYMSPAAVKQRFKNWRARVHF